VPKEHQQFQAPVGAEPSASRTTKLIRAGFVCLLNSKVPNVMDWMLLRANL